MNIKLSILGLLVLCSGCYNSIRTDPTFPQRVAACQDQSSCQALVNEARESSAGCERNEHVIYMLADGPHHFTCEEAFSRMNLARSKLDSLFVQAAAQQRQEYLVAQQVRQEESQKQQRAKKLSNCMDSFSYAISSSYHVKIDYSCFDLPEFSGRVKSECDLTEAKATIATYEEEARQYRLKKEVAEQFLDKSCHEVIAKTNCRRVWANTEQGIWEWINYCDEVDLGLRCKGTPPEGVDVAQGRVTLNRPSRPEQAYIRSKTCTELGYR